MLSPLKGTFPGIAKQTVFTKGEIKEIWYIKPYFCINTDFRDFFIKYIDI